MPMFSDLVSYARQAQLHQPPCCFRALVLVLDYKSPSRCQELLPSFRFQLKCHFLGEPQPPRQSDCSLFTCLEHLTTGHAYLSAG